MHHYQVLARTTRPKKFSEVIGQEGIVQALKNAIASGRLAHAFILTGVRGVGKTTLARLIACTLNCSLGDKEENPSEPCGTCEQCVAVFEDRHLDVVEVDAATRTGVDDMRQLLDGVMYKPVLGRYKIYIIDEVHMLSKSAFNALLKTLEEPPPHVKFIFATTEVQKVPATILSRCWRFELRRVPIKTLTTHFSDILHKEGLDFEPGALACIARAADGSVRDGLSILEQAIVRSQKKPMSALMVREMLGLMDPAKSSRVLELMLMGHVFECLQETRKLYEEGADPEMFLQDLMSLIYQMLSLKMGGKTESNEDPLCRLTDPIESQSLLMIWQVLLKGVEEMKLSLLPLEHLEMVLMRAMYVQKVMDDEDQRATDKKEKQSPPPFVQTSQKSPKTFESLIRLFEEKREPLCADYLIHGVSVRSFSEGHIQLKLLRPEKESVHLKIADLLKEYTGRSWRLELVDTGPDDSLGSQKQKKEEDRKKNLLETEEAEKLRALFPGSQVLVR